MFMYGKKNISEYAMKNTKDNLKMIPLEPVYGVILKEENYRKRIYLIGPCIVDGYGCTGRDTLAAQLQERVKAYEYQIIAISIAAWRFDVWKQCLSNLPIREKDIILVINHSEWFPEKNRCECINLDVVYEKEKRDSLYCYDTLHTNAKGNRLLAEEVSNLYLNNKIRVMNSLESNLYLQKGEILNREKISKVNEYIKRIKVNLQDDEVAGAIVMNANPFTLGHRYLVHFASHMVDKLYIFVVEEDKSFFKFEDRFRMVRKGTEDLANVIVVPSGEWILSYQTMPFYFSKDNLQETKVNAAFDLEIFARYVAPCLGIKKRFVGKEMLDKVTRQYNEQMFEILSLFNLEVIEIPRLKIKDEIVSATKVRKYFAEQDWNKLSNLVPETTIKVCKELVKV